jgi:uncharacterized damage-inducible protein DinB
MGEKDELLETLAAHRRGIRGKVADLSEKDAAKRTTVSELTLGGVIKHVTYAEELWIDFVVEGKKVDDLDRYAGSFVPDPEETVAVLLDRYAAAARRTEDVIRALPTLDVAHPLPEAPWYPPDTSWTARQVLLHILAETTQHAGHADILREALDGTRG